MLNKKHQILLTLIFVILGSSISFNNKIYSIMYLVGITNIQIHRIFIIILLNIFVGLLIVSIFRFHKVSKIFYHNMYTGNYDTAKKIIFKYYNQNKTLFFQHMMFYFFSVGDKENIEMNLKNYDNKNCSRKRLTCRTYKFLLYFINDENCNIVLNELINAHEKRKKKNVNLILLLRSIQSENQNRYIESLQLINKISKNYYYPSINKIINKVIETCNIKINNDSYAN